MAIRLDDDARLSNKCFFCHLGEWRVMIKYVARCVCDVRDELSSAIFRRVWREFWWHKHERCVLWVTMSERSFLIQNGKWRAGLMVKSYLTVWVQVGLWWIFQMFDAVSKNSENIFQSEQYLISSTKPVGCLHRFTPATCEQFSEPYKQRQQYSSRHKIHDNTLVERYCSGNVADVNFANSQSR